MFNDIALIHNYIAEHRLLTHGSKIILGLSGGPDSVFLLHVLAPLHHTQQIYLFAAHLDHQWRANSSADVTFCAQLCASLHIPFEHATIAELGLNLKNNGSKEAVGRAARRQFFEQLRMKHTAEYIALAHHADDQQENFFIRLMRGTTLTGLIGMQPRSGYYIRPLLTTKKSDIVAYLHTHAISYLSDPSNTSAEFLRNRVREKVIPVVRDADARFDNNFAHTLTHLHEAEQFLTHLTTDTARTVTTPSGELDLAALLILHPYLRDRVLTQWLYTHKIPFTVSSTVIDEITRFIGNTKSTRHQMHTHWILCKSHATLSIKKQ